jgi:hypothetical protein
MIDYTLLPDSLRPGMRRYIEHGVPTGSFLRAALENKLIEAYLTADMENRFHLARVAEFIHLYAPPECCGSEANVREWIARHEKGLRSKEGQEAELDRLRDHGGGAFDRRPKGAGDGPG